MLGFGWSGNLVFLFGFVLLLRQRQYQRLEFFKRLTNFLQLLSVQMLIRVKLLFESQDTVCNIGGWNT
jgi:hypothetical protein